MVSPLEQPGVTAGKVREGEGLGRLLKRAPHCDQCSLGIARGCCICRGGRERYEFRLQQGQWGLSSGEPGEAGVRKGVQRGAKVRVK